MRGTHDRENEVDAKVERVIQLARRAGVKGILIGLQPGFSWLTAGASNRIDGSREQGAGALLVTADGRRFVVANNIETPRLTQEAVAGLGFETADFAWTRERADPGLPFRVARDVAGGAIGSDVPSADVTFIEPALSRLRAPLLAAEIDRYRRLGADAGRIVGDVVRGAAPGATERQVAGELGAALMTAGIRPVVLLAAADERIARYRHPVAGTLSWRDRLLVATCAERDGLVIALTRIVCTRTDEELSRRTRAAAAAFSAMLSAAVASATGAEMFAAAARAYSNAGFPGEEQHHHQGGAIGYRAREWVAHPASQEVATLPQAFAWNPTVAGTKLEDTCLVHADGRVEVLTETSGWPPLDIDVRGQSVRIADVCEIGSLQQ
jgi:Xaa-Pro aminopeptidase